MDVPPILSITKTNFSSATPPHREGRQPKGTHPPCLLVAAMAHHYIQKGDTPVKKAIVLAVNGTLAQGLSDLFADLSNLFTTGGAPDRLRPGQICLSE